MNHLEKVKTIQYLRPESEFVLRGDNLEWLDDKQIEPTEQEIQEGWIAYQAKVEADKEATKAKREAALAKLAALGLDLDDLKALGI